MGVLDADQAVHPLSKRGDVEQTRLQNSDLRSSPGRRMPDGWTRQRPRTAMLEWEQDYRRGGSPFVWFVATIRPPTDSSLLMDVHLRLVSVVSGSVAQTSNAARTVMRLVIGQGWPCPYL